MLNSNHVLSSNGVIAHRGYSSALPENTMEAFEAAVELGAKVLELDIQKTRDGKLVVIHDPFVDRTANSTGLVENMTLAELRQLTFNKQFPQAQGSFQIPEFTEVLDFAKMKNIELNVEFKDYSSAYSAIGNDAAKLVDDLNCRERVSFASVNHRFIGEFKNRYPHYLCAMAYFSSLFHPVSYAEEVGVDIIHPHFSLVTPTLLRDAAHAGILVHAWTVDDPQQFKQLLDMGVRGIMTNNVKAMIEMI